jgi:NADPH-dependent curcumin reductase CurA
VIGSIVPIDKAPDAYRLLLDRKNLGKVVLKIT